MIDQRGITRQSWDDLTDPGADVVIRAIGAAWLLAVGGVACFLATGAVLVVVQVLT